MDLEEFEEALDEHGPDVEDWPANLRDAARLLLDQSSEARDLLHDELRLAAAFAMQPAPKAPSGLAERIVLRAMAESAPEPAPVPVPVPVQRTWSVAGLWNALAEFFPQPRYRYAFALTACFAIGLVGSQFLGESQDYGSSLYVSGIYADLAY